ncbi:MAG TPA: DUF2884 family protein [Luteimonas sp.]|nr:DUF2884 family protein [Luteimonas sp.]
MRNTWWVLVLFTASGIAAADDISCSVSSDYDLGITPKSVILTRDSGTPKALVMRQGRLFVDDRWVTLGAADRDRLITYEREARATMPLAQQIGHDAADIAFTTLGEVAAGFSSDPAASRAKLAKARAQLDARLARSVTASHFNGDDLGNGIGEAVRATLPAVIGDIVGGALGAVFSGDSARLQRMHNMDKDIQARVEPRARALERNARTLCEHMQSLDRIDDAFDYRLPGGGRLNLLQTKVEHRH